MPKLTFQAKLCTIDTLTLLSLPSDASAKLPTRGMVMVEGTINGSGFIAPLEPDGRGSHWLLLSKKMRDAAGAAAGETVALEITPAKEWPEPTVPVDVMKMLTEEPEVHSAWRGITTAARWDWLRWIAAAKQPETRKRRIENACSMLKDGKRRPCCFNRNLCTVPEVSHNGVLRTPQ